MVPSWLARIADEPRIVGSDLGTTPIFNWLLYGYGIPALSFWVAGWLLRRRADDLPARMVDAGRHPLHRLLVVLEIRHYITGGDIYQPVKRPHRSRDRRQCRPRADHRLERIRGRTGSIVHNVGALLIAARRCASSCSSLSSSLARDFTQHSGDRRVLQYDPARLRPARRARHHPGADRPHDAAAALPRRRGDHGGDTGVVLFDARSAASLSWPDARRPDQRRRAILLFVAWLVFGIALLAVGFFLRSQPARILALGVIALTVAKVFIIDTASISGIYRALSVIGLGVVLLGIGCLYQRLFFPRAPAAGSAASSE